MDIAIDALEINLNKKVGMGNYADNLIRSLSLLDRKNDYTLYVNKLSDEDNQISQNNFKYRKLNSPLIRSFWSQCRLPLELMMRKPDLLHLPTGHKVPFNAPLHTVVTIHDLAFNKFPDYFEASVRWRSQYFTQKAILKAEKIIAISEATKKDIIDYYNVDQKKIKVIYHGVEEIFKPGIDKQSVDAVCSKYGITLPFVLFIGVLQPRKNIIKLIAAFDQVLKSGHKNMQLVIVGGKGWMYEQIFDAAKLSRFSEKIVFTDYTPKKDVICLLNAAKVFVLPSLYEGFGLPILESMACGTPVIASNVSSMPEIVQDAGILIDPNNSQEITQSILDILDNQTLADELTAKGLKMAKNFSWEKTARETLDLYESMLKKRK